MNLLQVSDMGFNDPATLQGYEGRLMIMWKADKVGIKKNDYVGSKMVELKSTIRFFSAKRV